MVIGEHDQTRFVWALFAASLLPAFLGYLWAITPVFWGRG
jgi:hypothetical protein